jgi:hypothetical protein
VAKPDTILGWYRRLVAAEFDEFSTDRIAAGRESVQRRRRGSVRFARESSNWGYGRIAGVLASIGHNVSDQTVATRDI